MVTKIVLNLINLIKFNFFLYCSLITHLRKKDYFFINDNIFENLKFFKNNLSIEIPKRIIKEVDLDLPLSQKVGNQGKKISGGQKTKIALARALFNLKKIKRNMIQIFISHEIYEDMNFDKILKLERGRLLLK